MRKCCDCQKEYELPCDCWCYQQCASCVLKIVNSSEWMYIIAKKLKFNWEFESTSHYAEAREKIKKVLDNERLISKQEELCQ